jgi:glycosyltransferase involved in cell wall biosynthesis
MLTPTYLPNEGGTERAIQNIARKLTLRGHRVTIITPMMYGNPAEKEDLHVIRFGSPRAYGTKTLFQNIVTVREVVKQHMREPFDYVHFFDLFPFGLSSVFLAKVLHVPLMTSLMGENYWGARLYVSHSERPLGVLEDSLGLGGPFPAWIMNWSDVVTAPSKELAAEARAHGCHKRIEVIPHGVDPNVFDSSTLADEARDLRKTLGMENGEQMILTVHRLNYPKDLTTAILAFRLVLRHRPNTRLVVVGQGPEYKRFLRIATSEGVASSVIFTGWVANTELPHYYAAADLFLLSTFYETFGLVLVEAMAAAKCVIASRVGAVPEIVEDHLTGFLFPAGEVEVLAELILRTLEDDDLRTEMGRRGRERVLANYNWDRIAERYCAAFYSIRA